MEFDVVFGHLYENSAHTFCVDIFLPFKSRWNLSRVQSFIRRSASLSEASRGSKSGFQSTCLQKQLLTVACPSDVLLSLC